MSETTDDNAKVLPENPCKEIGPGQRAAYVWFVGAIVLGIIFTISMSGLDHRMFTHNAEVLDYHAYDENRAAASGISVERSDPRAAADLASVYKHLAGGAR